MVPALQARPLLVVRSLSITAADGRPLVRDIDLTLSAGQTLGIVGESGSGKSLTCRALLGVLPAGIAVSGGTIQFDGHHLVTLDRKGWRPLRGRRLSAVFQDPGSYLNPSIPVGHQISEAVRATAPIGRREARARALDLLDRVGIRGPQAVFRQYPFELSGGMLQRVLIAIAVSGCPDLLIADEPTTALDVTVQAEILNLLAELQRGHAMALILVSHDLAVVSQVADHVIVMRDGLVVERGPTDVVLTGAEHVYTRSLLAHHTRYSLRRFASGAPAQITQPARSPARAPTPLLQIDGVDFAYGKGAARRSVLRSVSLDIRAGESIGLIGETGSGKTTLLRSILGLSVPVAGEIRFEGSRIDDLRRGPKRAFRRSGVIQYVFQDPLQSLDPDLAIHRSIAEGLRIRGGLSEQEVIARIAKVLHEVDLDESLAARRPAELSGGQRQRAVLARALALDPKLLLLDEPVSALDATSRGQILDLLLRLGREREIAQIFVSHDLGSVAGTTDRIAVLFRGRIVECGPTADVLQRPQHPYTERLVASVPTLEKNGGDRWRSNLQRELSSTHA